MFTQEKTPGTEGDETGDDDGEGSETGSEETESDDPTTSADGGFA